MYYVLYVEIGKVDKLKNTLLKRLQKKVESYFIFLTSCSLNYCWTHLEPPKHPF